MQSNNTRVYRVPKILLCYNMHSLLLTALHFPSPNLPFLVNSRNEHTQAAKCRHPSSESCRVLEISSACIEESARDRTGSKCGKAVEEVRDTLTHAAAKGTGY